VNQEEFYEKLTPPFWSWIIILGSCLVVASSIGAVFDQIVAIIFFLLLLSIATFSVFKFSTVIRVKDNKLFVNKANIPLNIITETKALNAKQTRRIRGVGADPKCFSATSPFIKTAVKIEFDDPKDPHPYWLISSKRPEELSQVIEKNR